MAQIGDGESATHIVFMSSLGVSLSSQTPSTIDGNGDLLLGSEIALGGLDRGVPQQELDLLKVSARLAAELRAGAAEVVRSEILHPYFLGTAFDHRPY